MSAAIPVSSDDLQNILNLHFDASDPGAERIPITLSEHQPLVLMHLRKITTDEAYQAALANSDATDPAYTAFRFGYAFLALFSAAEFLNLNTLGKGIIRATGPLDNSTELLTGQEIESFKKSLERRALFTLQSYLNQTGRDRLAALTDVPGKRLRATVI